LLARYRKVDTFAPYLLYAFDGCNANRDEVVALLTRSFGEIDGARRILQQRIEVFDQCLAQRKLLEPSLRAWLDANR
jgi:hypothetical protein